MFGETKTKRLKKNADAGAAVATELAQDRKFRKELASAVRHGAEARNRVKRRIGLVGMLNRLAADEELRKELREMAMHLRKARARIEKKRSHKLRTTIVLAGGASAVAAAPKTRKLLSDAASSLRPGPRTIRESIDVEVPVSTAYNQWTQFEEFPRFMEGVESVRQLDDTRLHWVATVAGKEAEWDAKILEQHPDRQISWISEDGKATRGNVTFDELAPSRTRIELSMSYSAEGVREAIGSAAGLDSKRVRGDLRRFKDMIEDRGRETGAWRGNVAAGKSGVTS
jgi:uncharacterized membrane protein